jgi:glycosyltransferase involved in cell wall biosynthesis
MIHCSLAHLPPPPPGRTGWPWTEETPPLSPARSDGSPWPLISIVTPSYNQIEFIEETIRSILLQGYPNLEYIIIDGGSTAACVDIIRKYSPWLTHWVSEKDRGQAHAINKGLERCTGEIFQWINSDDVLFPGALRAIGEAYRGHGVAGSALLGYDVWAATIIESRRLTLAHFIHTKSRWTQPGTWLPLRNVVQLGIDERYDLSFDVEFFIRYLERYPLFEYLDICLVFYRLHKDSKTVRDHPVHLAQELRVILRDLSERLIYPDSRRMCREELHRRNWQRRLAAWQSSRTDRFLRSWRVARLGLRRPRVRASRFWLGALRRMIVPSLSR